MVARIDITGQRYHRLFVKEYVGGGRYLCVCDCGTEREFLTQNLKRGLSKSCGCLHDELRSEIARKAGKASAASRFPPELKEERIKEALRKGRIKNKKRREENPEKISEEKRKCYRAKRDKYIANSKKYYEENKEEILASRSAYAQKNAEKISAYLKEYTKEYIKKHPEYRRLRSANYRALLFKATPGWVNFVKVKEIYAYAKFLTDTTGVPYEVDHIVPLNSKHVCGLHWEGNLRVITKEENGKKSNKILESLVSHC